LGSARYRSWSHSRQELFNRCEKAFHFQYYPWDEPDTNEARFLARVKNHEMVAGDVIHWAIALAIRAYQRDRTVLTNLHESAIQRFREVCTASKWISDTWRAGKKPANDGDLLHSDVYGYDGKVRYWAARANVEVCLRNFEASEPWAFLRATDPKEWEEIDPPKDRMPRFSLPEKAIRHVSIYAGYDLVAHHGGLTYILDWKTGRRSSSASSQLAVYALCLASRGKKPVPLGDIRVQTVWLQGPCAWEPTIISEDEIAFTKARIADQIRLEESRSTWGSDGRGVLASIAERQVFPATPKFLKCAACKFGLICEEGKRAAGG
jgi:hypothetical protein